MKGYNERISVADQGFFQSFMECGGTVKEFEQVEALTGEILSVSSQTEKIKRVAMRETGAEYILWARKIEDGPDKLINIWRRINHTPPDYREIEGQIKIAVNEIKSTINLIDSGISGEDLEVIGTAVWLGEITGELVTVLADDRDLLSSAHLICSYTGKKVNFLSTYEVLIKMELIHLIKPHLNNYDLTPELIPTDALDRNQLELNLNQLARKARLGFHPSLRKRSISVTDLIS